MSRPDPTALADQAASAARIRELTLDPDVIALRVERIRAQVDALAWTAIGLGLAFTVVNVQQFAAAGAVAWSPAWLVAWLLDPMVSLLLIAVLRAEQVTARWQIATGWRVRATKWCCFVATYAMNTWAAWGAGVPSQVVLHSVPPLMVLLGAEVAPVLRDRLTEAVHAAGSAAAHSGGATTAAADEPAPAVGSPAATSAAHQDTTSGGRESVEELSPAEAGALLGRTGDAVLVRQREGALPAQLRYTDLAAGLEATDSGPAAGVSSHGRDGVAGTPVITLAELLAAGEPVTSAQAAAIHGVSDRQGRRLLREARDRVAAAESAANTSPATGALGDVDGRRLRVVTARADPGRTSEPAGAPATAAEGGVH